MVSKSYARRYPHLARKEAGYRSRVTGWQIRKEKIRRRRTEQLVQEVSRRRTAGARRKAVRGDVAELRGMTFEELEVTLQISPRYAGKVQWALTRGRMLLDRKTFDKLTDAFDAFLEEQDAWSDEDEDD